MARQERREVVTGFFHKRIDNVIMKSGVGGRTTKLGLSWKFQFSTKLGVFDSFNEIDLCSYFMWQFEWDEAALKEQGFDGYEGEVVACYYPNHNQQCVRLPFQVELIHPGQWIQRRIGTDEETKYNAEYRLFDMQFSLEKFSFRAKEEKEAVSKYNDAVLVVDENKINVNKDYLSLHSEYFDKLFNSEFNEKSMSEIPIDDVKYVDFARLLFAIHPLRSVLPTDETIEILLDLADRFMLPVVTERVINHLRYSSDLPFEEFLRIADKYKLHKLWQLNLKLIDCGPRMQLLTKNIEYEELSETAKAKLFSHFAKIIDYCSFSK